MTMLNMLGASAKAGGQTFAAYQENINDVQKERDAFVNAGYADAQAGDSLKRGATAAGLARMEASSTAAAQQVAYANSGVDASVGTAADVQASTTAAGEFNALTIKNNAAREAWGHSRVADKFRKEGGAYKGQRDARTIGTFVSTLGSLLGASGGGG